MPSLRLPLSRRRRALPPDVRAALPLEPGERPLAWAAAGAGRQAVATERALFAPVGGGWERLPWWQITTARWDDEQQRLIVQALTEAGPRTLRLALEEPAFLPETVRERVQSSIVVSEHVRLRGKAGVRLVARRVPGRDELIWQRLLDPGLDPGDPEIAALCDEATAQLRSQTTA